MHETGIRKNDSGSLVFDLKIIHGVSERHYLPFGEINIRSSLKHIIPPSSSISHDSNMMKKRRYRTFSGIYLQREKITAVHRVVGGLYLVGMTCCVDDNHPHELRLLVPSFRYG